MQSAIIFTFHWPAMGDRTYLRKLKGLLNAIGMTVVYSVRDDWAGRVRGYVRQTPPRRRLTNLSDQSVCNF